jgi:hypothetical protein
MLSPLIPGCSVAGDQDPSRFPVRGVLAEIPSAQVGQLFGFGGGRMSWLLREGPLAAA